jgi:protein-S-isoprenylcysteine O-methyltransferase Ste14
MTEPTALPPDLARRSLIGLAQFVVVLGLMLFLPAWSLTWVRGWLCWAVFNICCLVLTLYFLRHDSALVARRMRGGPTAEREASQRLIQSVMAVLVIALFILPGFDYRFGWSHVSWAVAIVGNLMVALGFWMIFFTFKANSYAAATVETSEGQTVISTGAYGVVRHPMYAGASILFPGIALALGSWWALVPGLLLLPLLAWRLTEEEAFLLKNLPGYADYRRKVRWRLLPLVW